MILNHYGLREQPFGATPDPQFLFTSKIHKEALASLLYAIESGRGFTALIAPPGLGKTTLLFHLMASLRGKAKTAFVFQTQCKPRELLRFLLKEFGVTSPSADFVAMHHALNDMLAAEAMAGRKCVIILDEAHNLSDSVLESVRLLSDFETSNRKLLHIIMAGQSELKARLLQPSLEQLRQRIGVVCKLAPLPPREIDQYIDHRLKAAGYSGPPLFTPAAMAIVREFSRGIPRNINALCFSAMSLGFALGRTELDAQLLEEAVADLSLEGSESQAGDETLTQESTPVEAGPVMQTEPSPPLPQDQTHPPEAEPAAQESPLAILRAAAGADLQTTTPLAEGHSSESFSASAVELGSTITSLKPEDDSVTAPDPLQNIDLSRFALLDEVQPKKKPAVSEPDRANEFSPWMAAPPATAPPGPDPELDVLKQRLAHHTYPNQGSPKGTSRDYLIVGLAAAVLVAAVFAALLWAHPNIGFAMGKSPEPAPNPATAVTEKTVDVPKPVQVPKRHASPLQITSAAGLKTPAPRLTSPEEIAPPPLPLNDQVQSERLQALVSTPTTVPRWDLVRSFGDPAINTPVVMVPPTYPESAKQNKLEGTVVLQILVDKNGKVRRLERIGGDPQLADAAIQAVRQWRYPPYVVNGKKQESNKQVEMRFSLGPTNTVNSPQ